MISIRRLFGPSFIRSSKPRFLTVPAGHVDEATLTADEFRKKHQIKISGVDNADPAFDPVASFDVSPFHQSVLRILDKQGFLSPTATQAQSWPVAAGGRDLISVAKTGSGKTLAFLAPAFSNLVSSKTKRGRDPKILVLAPTRELCLQIHKEATNFESIGIRSVACYGGASRYTQMNELRRGVDAVIATPGRFNDFLESGAINVSNVDYVVLDEADRMLDMGFEPQIREILNDIPSTKQMLLFTATWPKEVVRLADSYVKSDAVHIHIGDEGLNANKAIKQNFIMLDKPRGGVKMGRLIELMKELRADKAIPKSIPKIIMFCSRKSDCDFMAEDLDREGYSCAALHGDKSQSARDSILDNFRKGRTRVLIATDVASRGLDVRDVEVVINYDFPTAGVEDYIHRIGRTARGERTGTSYTFFTSADETHAADLLKILEKSGQEIPDELYDMVQSRIKPPPRKSRYGTSGSSESGRYGKQRDGGFQRRDKDGGYQRKDDGFGDRRGYSGPPKNRNNDSRDSRGSRSSRDRYGDEDGDDMFDERRTLRGWTR